MTDPTLARMSVGFEICAIAVFVWASIDYNRFIKFWMLKPAPYKQWVRVAFRIFFLACVVGGVWRVAEDVVRLGKPATFYLSALPFTAAWFVVFYCMLRVVEWTKRKRDTKRGLKVV
jgi:hypothetical protein